MIKNTNSYNNYPLRFGSEILNPTIDEDRAKITAELKNYRFNMEEVWPEEDDNPTESIELPGPSPLLNTTSTPVKTDSNNGIMAIPLYRKLLEDNSFNSTLDDIENNI